MSTATTSLLDLLAAGLLQPGNKVMVRDIEGELTPQGTIISTTERGTIEYKTPTAFSKAVTNSTSGGWQQVKLKSSGGSTSLFDVKRKFAGYTSKRPRGLKGSRSSRSSSGSSRRREHPAPVSHISVSEVEDGPIKIGNTNVTLPILVRFRDDDTKRGKITRVGDDYNTFDLEYKGKTYHTVSSASREMYREYAEETGEVVSINSNGFEELKYQTPSGDWYKLRELFPVEIRNKRYTTRTSNSQSNEDDEEEDQDETMSDDSNPPTPPPLTPPSPSSSSTPPPQQRSTMIAKHIKHSLLPSSDSPTSSTPILPIKPPTSPSSGVNIKPAPLVLSLKSPPPPQKRVPKDIELLVHIDSTDSIPYEVTGMADSYDSLRNRISHIIPDFPFSQAHELGVYSEYWEKHAGVAYVKPPRNWADFPACTTVLLKKIPETIIINNSFDL